MGIASLLATVLPAFLPVAIDGVKTVLSKLTGVSMGEPRNFQDFIEMEKLKVEKLKALAALDNPNGEISKWVANLRGCFRYVAVGIIVVSAIVYNFLPVSSQSPDSLAFFNQLMGSATFFIIGDRVYLGLKNGK